ncbi:MaoC family dehydratase [Sphingobium sp. 3R8]|uniref:MaoC family dehydratase n=1 Tax=Sphingobium sp. 3R8 TaxID=2874921 RepID=UPI001CC97567|nr:MaoC family dehydratase [Sphingobium sp. 3R8]MBZ9646893.1 MaoC family dehydratase [Sphingobium sp. 3R8]
MEEDFRERAVFRDRGHLFEDFEVGQAWNHHWGKTVSAAENSLFCSLLLIFNPLYLNAEYAKAHGHPDIVINPHLLFNVVLGLSVEDLSEIGGPFLGVFDLTYVRPAYAGTTIVARSKTLDARVSSSNPANGIVTWQTTGYDEAGLELVSFRRSNLVRRRNIGEAA